MGKSRKNHGKTPAPKAPNQLSGHSRVAAWEETSRDRRSSRVASPGGGTPWDAMGEWIQGGTEWVDERGKTHTHIHIYIYHHVYIIHIYIWTLYIYGENAMVSVLYGPISKIEVFLLRKRLTSCMNDFGWFFHLCSLLKGSSWFWGAPHSQTHPNTGIIEMDRTM